MPANRLPIGSYVRIDKPQLQVVIDILRQRGFRTVGPRVVDDAILYRDIDSIDQLPIGVLDEQDGGRYRLRNTKQNDWFIFSNGPDSLKNFLFPSREILLESHRTDGNWRFESPQTPIEPLAVLGVRPCDLKALEIQDRIFLEGPYIDQSYQRRREALFVVAVNCSSAAPTCFCHSMGAGPKATKDFDLAFTELDSEFVIEVGTNRGGEVVATTQWSPCTLEEVEGALAVTENLKQEMRRRSHQDASPEEKEGPRLRHIDMRGVRELLLENLDHSRWEEIADRCLACANCTLVCPTCFCSAVEEVSDLSGDHVARVRTWDSCFMAEHSYTNTGTVRKTTASRYRQWLTHKLATWQDQFDVIGCVGCGRCITWCPVGIDLTEEVAAMRGKEP